MITNMEKGLLIAFEGIDCTGKSTQCARIKYILEDLGYSVITTREPTDGEFGQLIRNKFFKERPTPEDELDAFIKDRKEHIAKVIAPALSEKKIILVDRYYMSTAAYQGAQGVAADWIIALNECFAPKPDLWVIIDLDPEKAMKRIVANRGTANAFETLEHLQAVAAYYQKQRGVDVVHIDGSLSVEYVTHEIAKAIYLGPLTPYIEKTKSS